MLPRAYLAGEEACIHGFTSIKSLWKNIQQRDDISYLWRKMLRSLSGRKKKTKRPFFETIWNQKAREWSTTRKWPLKITPPMWNFYQIAYLLSTASNRLSSSLLGGPESEHILKERKAATRRRYRKAQDLGSQGRGFMAVFPLTQSSKV